MSPSARCFSALLLSLGIAKASEHAFFGAPPDATHPWAVHDRNRPLPAVIKPGDAPGEAPSDATLLFDGKSLDAWEGEKDGKSIPAPWEIVDGALRVVPKKGTLRTKAQFGDCQLHIEWATPSEVSGESQGRGNSGVFFIGGRYEVQVLDNYQNPTYADGFAGAVYAQNPPMVNACRAPGVWQSYDIVFRSPRFDTAGNLLDSGSVTVLHNGVLVQDHWLYEGNCGWKARAKFSAHPPKGPIELQDHGNQTRFRNIWIRELAPRHTLTPDEVQAQRQATAKSFLQRAGIAATPRIALMATLESLVYASDQAVIAQAKDLANHEIARLAGMDKDELKKNAEQLRELRNAFLYLAKYQLVPQNSLPLEGLERLMKKADLDLK